MIWAHCLEVKSPRKERRGALEGDRIFQVVLNEKKEERRIPRDGRLRARQPMPVTESRKTPPPRLCMRITETEIALRRPTGAFPRPEIISRAEQKDIAKGGH